MVERKTVMLQKFASCAIWARVQYVSVLCAYELPLPTPAHRHLQTLDTHTHTHTHTYFICHVVLIMRPAALLILHAIMKELITLMIIIIIIIIIAVVVLVVVVLVLVEK